LENGNRAGVNKKLEEVVGGEEKAQVGNGSGRVHAAADLAGTVGSRSKLDFLSQANFPGIKNKARGDSEKMVNGVAAAEDGAGDVFACAVIFAVTAEKPCLEAASVGLNFQPGRAGVNRRVGPAQLGRAPDF